MGLEPYIIALVLAIAPQERVPPYLVMSIIVEESQGNPRAVGRNENGTVDRGLMQLNSSWYDGDWRDPETNIRAGCKHLRQAYDQTLNWWQATIAYNCGIRALWNGPPERSLNYANRIFERWNKHDPARWYAYPEPKETSSAKQGLERTWPYTRGHRY